MSALGAQFAAQQFAALHQPGRPFLLPNAWDVASALMLAGAGFPAVGTTSMGVTAAAGLVDGAGTGRDDTLALASAIVPRLPVPVTVDAEGGYSDDPAAVADLAAGLAALGAAGINLEDAAPGGGLRPLSVQAAIISAVAAAAPGLFVNARTDVYWLQAGAAEDRLGEASAQAARLRRRWRQRDLRPGAHRHRGHRPGHRRSRACRSTCCGGPARTWPSSRGPG